MPTAHRGGVLVKELVERVLALEEGGEDTSGIVTKAEVDGTLIVKQSKAYNHESGIDDYLSLTSLHLPLTGPDDPDVIAIKLDLMMTIVGGYPGLAIGNNQLKTAYLTKIDTTGHYQGILFLGSDSGFYNKRTQILVYCRVLNGSVVSLYFKPLSGYYGGVA